MTAVPPPPLSGCPENMETAELPKITDIKKNLEKDFDTPKAVKKRVSRLSQNFEAINSDFLRVYLRLRPFLPGEEESGENQNCVKVSDDRYILTLIPPKTSNTFKAASRGIGDTIRHYTFSGIFDPTVQQKDFFDSTALPLVQDFVGGNNSLIFTYGVTNAGKTYTIQGSPGNEGILPRAVEHLFSSVGDQLLERVNFGLKMAHNLVILSDEDQNKQKEIKEEVLSLADEVSGDVERINETKLRQVKLQISNEPDVQLQTSNVTEGSSRVSGIDNSLLDETASDTTVRSESFQGSGDLNKTTSTMQGPVKYAVFVSFCEVYNNLIYDLLVPFEDKREKRRILRLADDSSKNPYIKGLRNIQVNSKQEVMKILELGSKNLSMASTKLNKDSSRSHCISTMTLVQVMDIPEPQSARVSQISFCDLAGSERTNKTREVGDRLKEANKINTSLMNLGRCIDALRHNQLHKNDKRKQKVIPFRDSRITRLFQNFLLGQGRACMIVNANMCASAFDETTHVLKLSAIAREVQVINKPKPPKSRTTLFEGRETGKGLPLKKPRATIAWEKGKTSPRGLGVVDLC